MLFVDEDLTPVFDDDVSRSAALIVKEGTAQIRPREAIHCSPLAIDSVQLLEFGLLSVRINQQIAPDDEVIEFVCNENQQFRRRVKID